MNIDWGLAGAVILSGLIIVFVILIILILCVMATGKIVVRAGQKASFAKSPAEPESSAPVLRPAASLNAVGIEEETVAAISAAVYSYMDITSPGVSYAIKSISRATGKRPVWGFAGMQQNTRPF